MPSELCVADGPGAETARNSGSAHAAGRAGGMLKVRCRAARSTALIAALPPSIGDCRAPIAARNPGSGARNPSCSMWAGPAAATGPNKPAPAALDRGAMAASKDFTPAMSSGLGRPGPPRSTPGASTGRHFTDTSRALRCRWTPASAPEAPTSRHLLPRVRTADVGTQERDQNIVDHTDLYARATFRLRTRRKSGSVTVPHLRVQQHPDPLCHLVQQPHWCLATNGLFLAASICFEAPCPAATLLSQQPLPQRSWPMRRCRRTVRQASAPSK